MLGTFQQYFREGYSESICFIDSIINIDNLLESISALSNTSGGTLFIGVNSKGKVLGVNPIDIDKSLENIFNVHFNYFLDCKFELINHKHLYFVVLYIDEVIKKPLFFLLGDKKLSYIRVKSINIKAFNILKLLWDEKYKNSIGHAAAIEVLSDEHILILSSLSQKEAVSFTTLHSLLNLPLIVSEKCLVDLLLLNKIKYLFDNVNIKFTLK